MGLEQWAVYAQIASAAATGILAVAVFFQIKAAREQAEATRATVSEMEENRRTQERPQVIVETDHSRPPFVFVVVRNIGKGAARGITFQFSSPVESPQSADPHSLVIPVNEQPYFQRGMDYLAPGAEIPCLWGSMIDLAAFLRKRGLQDGITVTSNYKSLTGEPFETKWILNPLLIVNRLSLGEGKGIEDIAEATEKIAEILSTPVSSIHDELRVTTYEERQRRALLLEQIRNFLKEKLRDSESGDSPEVCVNRHEIEFLGQNSHTAAKLFELYINIPGYWFGEYEDFDETGEWVSFRLTNVT